MTRNAERTARRFLPARTALLAVVSFAALPMLPGCSDNEPNETKCEATKSGPTAVAPACSTEASSSERTLVAETFRAHAVDASSIAGMARRQVDGAVAWFGTCIADVIVKSIADAFIGTQSTGPICGEWEEAASYTFRDGEYRFDLRNAVTFYGSKIVDTESSSSMRLAFTKPVAGFAEGTIVPFDLGRADTYLVDVRVVTVDGKPAIAYERPGPLVELLGLGPTPANPLVVTEADARKMQDTMRSSLAAEGSTRASMSSCGGRSVIALDLDRTPIASDFRPRLVSATTTGTGTAAPTVVARTWDVVYTSGAPGIPEGAIEADLPSDALATTAKVRFVGQDPLSAELDVACATR